MEKKTVQNKKVKSTTAKKSTTRTSTAKKTPTVKKTSSVKRTNTIKKTSTVNKTVVKPVVKNEDDFEENLRIINSRKVVTTEPPKVIVRKEPKNESKVLKRRKKLRLKSNVKYIALTLIAILLLISIYNLLFNIKDHKKINNNITEEVIEPKEDVVEEYDLSLVMVGDYLIHGAIYDDAKRKTGNYDFHYILENYKSIISKYDLAFYNQESILGGTSLGLSSYPRFNAPQEAGDAMVDLGFNLVSLANNHSLDKGEKGILSSVSYWKTKEGVMTAGSYSSFEERDKDVIMEKNGITYALLSYTTTTNGLSIPSGKEYLVNVYSDEQAKKDIERLRDKVDLLMVSMHWGEEYTHTPTAEQERIANYLASLNVNIIIGHHPHVIQPVDFIGDTMVIYSLGNFVASQYGAEKLTGLVMSVDVHKKVVNGKTTISLNNPTASLSYMYSVKSTYRHSYKMYPYEMLNDNLLSGYKSYYSKFMDIVTKRNKNISFNSL